jgi:hypothetical protein
LNAMQQYLTHSKELPLWFPKKFIIVCFYPLVKLYTQLRTIHAWSCMSFNQALVFQHPLLDFGWNFHQRFLNV